MKKHSKPVVLIILDGWGIAPDSDGNGITRAKTPNFEKYVSNYPAMTLLASGEAVGLSWGEMGNSEVGHLNLGVGKIFYQNLPRIDKAVQEGALFDNKALEKAVEHVKKNNSKLHLMGLMSEGKVHGMNSHCYGLLDVAKRAGLKEVYVHAFLDGRDSPYNSGKLFIEEAEKQMKKMKIGKLASIHGRLYAMDRDNRWERVEKTYKALAEGKSEEYYKKSVKSVDESYKNKVYDEEFVPVVIGDEDKPIATIGQGDAIVFYNYRSDRARQLTHTFIDDKFDKFDRGEKIKDLLFVTMTEYEEGLPVEVIFPKEKIKMSLPKVLSEKGYKQLHIAETEKYAHVTFFFSGGQEEPFDGEDRLVVPSPRVSSYAEKPEMSAKKVTEKLVKEIMSEKYDFIVVNIANPDMVGHTSEIDATIKAVEFTDKCLGDIVETTLSKGGVSLVVADHGNAEELVNLQTGEKDKEHSTNPVPFLVIGNEFEGKTSQDVQVVGNDLSLVQPVGLLSDVPATILKLLNIDAPDDMSGKPLI